MVSMVIVPVATSRAIRRPCSPPQHFAKIGISSSCRIRSIAATFWSPIVIPLWKAARFINPDFDLNFPDNATPDLIKEDVRLELHQALSFLDQGKMDRVEEILIRTLLRIVTPIKR